MINKPTLLVDKQRCQRNIRSMAAKAKRNETIFRPHFKTHQSLEIGSWFKTCGVSCITVSSVDMAVYFSEEWYDITIAFPVNILEIEEINSLADKISLNLLVESEAAVVFLAEHIQHDIELYIKIDVGTLRTGLQAEDSSIIDSILRIIDLSERLTFKGFLSHAGHTYSTQSIDEIQHIHQESAQKLVGLKERYQSNYPDLIISVGDTPSCSVVEDFSMVDEMRPGNFVFYDLMQYQLEACQADQIAVAVACPIVAIHADRFELIIYGGGVHFSKERINYLESDDIYGHVVARTNSTWGRPIPDMYVRSLSQEHGIVKVPPQLISQFNIGDVLYILPVHSCMTMNLMRNFSVIEIGS